MATPCAPRNWPHRARRRLTRPRGARLGAEAVSVGGHLDGQLRLGQDLVHVHATQRDLRGARQADGAVAHAVNLRQQWAAAGSGVVGGCQQQQQRRPRTVQQANRLVP